MRELTKKNENIFLTLATRVQFLKFRPTDYEVGMLPSSRQSSVAQVRALFPLVIRKL